MPAVGRFVRAARWCDQAIGVLVVFAGLFAIGWYPGALVFGIWPAPMPVAIAVRVAIAALVIAWAKLSMQRTRPAAPRQCSISVHVYADELATTCICGCTGDLAGSDGAL